MPDAHAPHWPHIRTIGIDGLLVSFADQLSEPANRAALAFREAIDQAGWEGSLESSTSLVSAYLRFDPLVQDHATMGAALQALLHQRDWYSAPLPHGRKLWRVPTVFGGETAPQLAEAAAAAGLTPSEAMASIAENRVRVQSVGFAPGMPYLGELPPAWDIPRQTALTDKVPAGGLCVAIRQLVLFPVATPTGWRHIGQTALQLFRPDAEMPFVLSPGDEVQFLPITADELADLVQDPNGGATSELIA